MVLGFDSVFSHAINPIIIDHIRAVEGEVVAEAYFNRKNCDYAAVIEQLRLERPDVIITTQGNSLSNQFFEAIAQEDEQIQSIPIFTLGANSASRIHKIVSASVSPSMVISACRYISIRLL